MMAVPSFLSRLDVSIWLLLALIAVPELMICAAEVGWIGSPLWRPLSVQNGAFWPGLLRDWEPNYAAQPLTMFLTYSVLHISFWHMLGNMLVLYFLGPHVIDHLGRARFVMVWGVSAIIGGVCFALLSQGPIPMVGASGSVFGLLGVVVTYRYVHTGRFWAGAGIVAGLVLLHLVPYLMQGAAIAWQPHLGGFLTGALVAGWTGPRTTATTGGNWPIS